MSLAGTDEGLQPGGDQRARSGGPGPPIVVCLEATSRHGEQLLEYGAAFARGLGRTWYGLCVDTGEVPLDAAWSKAGEWVQDLREQIRDLGGTVFTYRADDAAETIMRFARDQGADTLVVERPPRRAWWHRWLSADDTVSRLIHEARGVAVVVVDAGPGGDPDLRPGAFPSTDGLPPPLGGPSGLADQLRAGVVDTYDAPMLEDQVVDRLVDRLDARYPGLHLDRLKPALVRDRDRHRLRREDDVLLLHADLEGLERPMAALGLLRMSLDTGRPAAIVVAILLTPAGQPEVGERARQLWLDLLDDRGVRTRLQARVTAESALELVAEIERDARTTP